MERHAEVTALGLADIAGGRTATAGTRLSYRAARRRRAVVSRVAVRARAVLAADARHLHAPQVTRRVPDFAGSQHVGQRAVTWNAAEGETLPCPLRQGGRGQEDEADEMGLDAHSAVLDGTKDVYRTGW